MKIHYTIMQFFHSINLICNVIKFNSISKHVFFAQMNQLQHFMLSA